MDDQSNPNESGPSTDPEVERALLEPGGMEWMGEHLADIRKAVVDQRFLHWSLGIGFVLGLLAHVVGYSIRVSSPGEPLGFLADLLYSLGFALWTGVVVVLFVQIIPEAKQRQIERAIDAYEAAVRKRQASGTISDRG